MIEFLFSALIILTSAQEHVVPFSTDPIRNDAEALQIPEIDDPGCVKDSTPAIIIVVLEFDIMEDGSVENVRVIASSDYCYNLAAVRAAERWQYNPNIVDGTPQKRFAVRTTIQFAVGDEDSVAASDDLD